MQDRKLGRGLSALLGESKSKPEESESGAVKLISLNKIIAGAYQPRKHFDKADLAELANSIKESGLIQPIILRKIREDHYEIIAGERRFRATKIAGLDKIPSIVKKLTNHEALEMAIVENIQRSDLSAIEEAKGYQRLIEEFSYTHEDISKKTGKSRSHVTNFLRLLSLPTSVRDLVDKNMISMGHAKAIVNSDNPEKLAKKAAHDSLTVRDVEELVRNEKSEKEKVRTVGKGKQSKQGVSKKGELDEIRNEISKLLKAEVKLSYSQSDKSGKIIINFSDLSEAKRIVRKFKK